MAIQNATDVLLKITTADGLEAIAHATSASISMSTDLRDSTTKSSLGFQENLGGLKSWEMSGDAFVDIASPTGADIESLWTVWNARSVVSCTFGLSGMTYTGNAIITRKCNLLYLFNRYSRYSSIIILTFKSINYGN